MTEFNWASQSIHEHSSRVKTLFATHHELNEMSDLFPRIKNAMFPKELKDTVLFMKIGSGGVIQFWNPRS